MRWCILRCKLAPRVTFNSVRVNCVVLISCWALGCRFCARSWQVAADLSAGQACRRAVRCQTEAACREGGRGVACTTRVWCPKGKRTCLPLKIALKPQVCYRGDRPVGGAGAMLGGARPILGQGPAGCVGPGWPQLLVPALWCWHRCAAIRSRSHHRFSPVSHSSDFTVLRVFPQPCAEELFWIVAGCC